MIQLTQIDRKDYDKTARKLSKHMRRVRNRSYDDFFSKMAGKKTGNRFVRKILSALSIGSLIAFVVIVASMRLGS